MKYSTTPDVTIGIEAGRCDAMESEALSERVTSRAEAATPGEASGAGCVEPVPDRHLERRHMAGTAYP